jgi:lipoprotein signal peptidase
MQTARGASLSDADTPSSQSQRPSARVVALLAATAFVVLVADLVSKIEVVRHLAVGDTVDVVGSFLRLTLTRNPGAAFSIGTGQTAVFALVAVGVIVVIIRFTGRLRSTAWAVTLGLLLGGALGNLVDRLFRAPGPLRGYVVDWIQLPHWPVFNLADSAIVCGGALAVLLTLLGVELDGRRAVPPDPPGDARSAADAPSTVADRD